MGDSVHQEGWNKSAYKIISLLPNYFLLEKQKQYSELKCTDETVFPPVTIVTINTTELEQYVNY